MGTGWQRLFCFPRNTEPDPLLSPLFLKMIAGGQYDAGIEG
jgi:hypothetical protein